MKKWEILDKQKTDNRKQITEKDIIRILLKNRGIVKKGEIEEFLNPSLEHLTPEKVQLDKDELDKAVARIKKAINDKELIVVYTDYDVDGVCSGAIIWETLYNMGAKIMPYVPHRVEEGYGLSKKGIDFVKRQYNPKLIITVDHGITAFAKIEYLTRLGIDTIILDHHLKPKKLPKSIATIHTTKLSAGGIAWVFARELTKSDKLDKLDLAALATIADLIPLTSANRTIVKFGLEQLNKTERVGLAALIKDAGLEMGNLGVYEVGYILAPRINAMGRLTHALDALRLICTRDQERASLLARQLSSTNRERQVLTERSTIQAIEMVRHEQLTKLLFISHKEFKEGIIGLVAGKLVEEFYRPAIVISQGEIFSKASARSVNGFNIVETVRQAGDLLEDVGGHPMAAGFTIATKNIKLLKDKLQEIADRELDDDKLTRLVKIDAVLDLNDISLDFYEKLQQLGPFGVGNPEPVFVSYGVEIIGAFLVGKDKKHLKLKIRQNTNVCNSTELGFGRKNNAFNAIGFNMGDVFRKISPHQLVDIAYSIQEDSWNGKTGLQLKLKDVKFPH